MKGSHLIWIRRISQGFFLSLFLFLLIQTRFPSGAYRDYSLLMAGEKDIRVDWPVTFFFELDPLVWVTSFLSGHAWIEGSLWAVAVMLLTLLLGRFFCGFVCPLGTIHHMVSVIRPSLQGKALIEANQEKGSRRVKYFLLVLVLVSALLGLNVAGLLDPISLLFRSLSLALFPAVGNALKAACDVIAGSDLKPFNLLGYAAEEIGSPLFGYGYPAYQSGWLIGGIFLVTLFLNRLRFRFWCRTLCPLGALFGLISRFSLLRLEKRETACTRCGQCTLACQGAASPGPEADWNGGECLLCFNCFHRCPEDAITFRFRRFPATCRGTDPGRRAVLGGLLAGVSIPLLGRLDGQVYKVSDPRLIRPPGSLEERDFLRRCQRCGLCMKVCPTNAIHPALAEGGVAGLWTPRLIMTLGYCEYTCTLCGSVCPTGAIAEISRREKVERPIRIGSAYLDRGRCLPWSGNGPCIVCEEHCPTSPKAIYLRPEAQTRRDGTRVMVQLPYVDMARCVGCGICENKCPVRGRPAIRVMAAGETRSVRNQILLD